jgi:hypothetical protein
MAISNNNTGIRTGVCTSSTRPTTPYEGQHIYETDTDIEYVWNGSAWVVNYVSAVSPAFTGTPTAPTAAAGTSTTQLATTAFVQTHGAWQSYSPSISAWTVGNGTLTGRYCTVNKLVVFEILFTVGSTSNTSALGPIIGFPTTATSGNKSGFSFRGVASDASTGYNYIMSGSTIITSNFYPFVMDVAGTYPIIGYTSSTTPMTWATGDTLYMQGIYEGA